MANTSQKGNNVSEQVTNSEEATAKPKRTRLNLYNVQYVSGDKSSNDPFACNEVVIIDKDGNEVKADLSQYDDKTIRALAAYAVATATKQYLNNHADKETGANVLQLAEAKLGQLKEGQITGRKGGGGGRGRVFDPSAIVEAVRRAQKQRGKTMTDEQADQLAVKLIEMPAKDRTAQLREWNKDAIFAYEYSRVLTERKKGEVKQAQKENVDLLDNFL